MQFRNLKILFIFLFTSILIISEADAQLKRNPYAKRKKKNKSISVYKGSNRSSRGGGRTGRFRPYAFLEGNINALNYYGDLAPVSRAGSTDVSFTRPGFGGSIGYKFHPSAAFRASYNFGLLKGDDITADVRSEEDAARYYRNLSFRNSVNEVTAGFMFFFFPDNNGPTFRAPINIYLFLGGGFFRHNPKGKVPDQDYQLGNGQAPPKAGEWVSLRDLGTEGQYLGIPGAPKPYSKYEFNIPIALGGTMRIPRTPINISMELGYRVIFTDYLDDVSTNYVDLTLFTDPLARIMSDRSSEPIGAFGDSRQLGNVQPRLYPDGSIYNSNIDLGAGLTGSKRGSPKSNDTFFMTQVKVTYILARRFKTAAKFR